MSVEVKRAGRSTHPRNRPRSVRAAVTSPVFSDTASHPFTRRDRGGEVRRAPVKAQKMIEEIGADSSVYFVAGSPHSILIPFIWDNARKN